MQSIFVTAKSSVELDDYEFSAFAQNSNQLGMRELLSNNMIYFKEVQAGLNPEMLSQQEYGTDKYWDVIVMLNASEMYVSIQDNEFVMAESERLAEKWKSIKLKGSKAFDFDNLGYNSAKNKNNRKRRVAFLREEYIPYILGKYRDLE